MKMMPLVSGISSTDVSWFCSSSIAGGSKGETTIIPSIIGIAITIIILYSMFFKLVFDHYMVHAKSQL